VGFLLNGELEAATPLFEADADPGPSVSVAEHPMTDTEIPTIVAVANFLCRDVMSVVVLPMVGRPTR
jgi:hypothetical protein